MLDMLSCSSNTKEEIYTTSMPNIQNYKGETWKANGEQHVSYSKF